MDPISAQTKTLRIDKPSADVIAAIEFIPALSTKYKIVKTSPDQERYTFSGEELSSAGVYIDVSCSSNHQNNTDVTLAVRRRTGLFEKSSAFSLADQHLDTVFNLLSDSLALEPSTKSRLLSTRANEKTMGEHRISQTTVQAKRKDKEEKSIPFFTNQLLMYVGFFFLFCALAYCLYKYFGR